MNSKYSTINFGLFTLERCHNYNCVRSNLSAWRIQSHKLLGWYPVWGPWQFTRLSALFAWFAEVWEGIAGPKFKTK